MMHLVVILISLHLFGKTCVKCRGNISTVDLVKNATSNLTVSESKRPSHHNRLNVHGEYIIDEKYNFTAIISWYNSEISKRDDIESTYSHQYRCSGIIVSRLWVLTAASCFQPRINYESGRRQRGKTLIMAMEDGDVNARSQRRATVSVHVHADHHEIASRGDVDVALVKLGTPFSLDEENASRQVSVARLGGNFPYSSNFKDSNRRGCFVLNYGQPWADPTEQEQPFSLMLNKYDVLADGPKKYCQVLQAKLDRNKTFPSGYFDAWDPKTEDMFDGFFICATPKRSRNINPEITVECYGEVGGALVCSGAGDVVLGVQSATFSKRDCEDDDMFITFTSVGHERVYGWMKGIVTDLPAIGENYHEQESENDTVSSVVTTFSNEMLRHSLLLALPVIAYSF